MLQRLQSHLSMMKERVQAMLYRGLCCTMRSFTEMAVNWLPRILSHPRNRFQTETWLMILARTWTDAFVTPRKRDSNSEIVLLRARTVTDDLPRREQHQYTTNKKHVNKQKIQQKTSFNNVDPSTSKSKVMRALELRGYMD